MIKFVPSVLDSLFLCDHTAIFDLIDIPYQVRGNVHRLSIFKGFSLEEIVTILFFFVDKISNGLSFLLKIICPVYLLRSLSIWDILEQIMPWRFQHLTICN